MASQPVQFRRVIGPIPPRDPKTKRLKIEPQMGERVKVNVLGEYVRDDKGQPIVEVVDLRDPRDYIVWEPGAKPSEQAIKGLKLFQVDLPGEPLVQVYARHEDEAVRVWKAEMGIHRLGQDDPKVTEVSA